MGIFQNAASIAKALAVQISAGCPIAGKEEQKERHDICENCPSLMKEEYRCGECKCFLLLKVPLKTSVCPLNHWPNLMKEDKNE